MYTLSEFASAPDARGLWTAALQRAIDTCHTNGGGCVVVPAGTYRIGTLYLRNNVELHLETGAMLLASECLEDYNDPDAYPQNHSSQSEGWCGKHLIVALECENVAITGGGCIDGSADAFFEEVPRFYPDCHWQTGYGWRDGFTRNKDKAIPRPGQMLAFVECRHVRVQDVTLQNAPCWTCHFHGCEFVQVRGVKIHSKPYRGHVDGIDIDCCAHVTVSDSLIEAGDDAITFRCNGAKLLHRESVCEYVTVSNCVLRCSAGAFRAGVGEGIVRHVTVENITVKKAGSVFTAITSYCGHGRAEISDIRLSNVSAPDLGYLFDIEANNAPIRDLTLCDMQLRGMAQGSILAGDTGSVKGISLKHLSLTLLPECEELTERRRLKRGEDMLLLSHVRGAALQDVRVTSDATTRKTWRSSFFAENCTDVTLQDCDFMK